MTSGHPLLVLPLSYFDAEAGGVMVRCAECGYQERWEPEKVHQALLGIGQCVMSLRIAMFHAYQAQERLKAETEFDLEAWNAEVCKEMS